VKKWKHYLMGKETIIHTDHQRLQYFHSQTKLQQSRHYRWMGFLQQFHLFIRYKKGIHNKGVLSLENVIHFHYTFTIMSIISPPFHLHFTTMSPHSSNFHYHWATFMFFQSLLILSLFK